MTCLTQSQVSQIMLHILDGNDLLNNPSEKHFTRLSSK